MLTKETTKIIELKRKHQKFKKGLNALLSTHLCNRAELCFINSIINQLTFYNTGLVKENKINYLYILKDKELIELLDEASKNTKYKYLYTRIKVTRSNGISEYHFVSTLLGYNFYIGKGFISGQAIEAFFKELDPFGYSEIVRDPIYSSIIRPRKDMQPNGLDGIREP